jgi:hypothetical protein
VEDYRARYEPREEAEALKPIGPPGLARDRRRRSPRPPGPFLLAGLAVAAVLVTLLVIGLVGEDDEPDEAAWKSRARRSEAEREAARAIAHGRRLADEGAELDRPPQDVVHGGVRLDIETSAALAPCERDVDRVRAGSGDDEVGLEADDLAYVDLAGRADDLAGPPGRAYARRNADEAAADPECAQELGRACVDGDDALRRLLDDGRLVSGALHRHGVGLRHLSERLAPLPAAGCREREE